MMKKLILLFLLMGGVAAAQDKPILVEASWLHANLVDPKIVILQTSGMKYDYDREHIAGARYLWPALLAPDSPYGAFNAPDPEKATELLRSFGINNDSHVILCHVRSDVSVTARMFLTLENLGLRGRVSFLNGGLEAWKKEGFPVTAEVRSVKPGKFKANPVGLLVDKNYVLSTLKSEKATVVDARMKNFYDGDPTGNPRDGHITGAKNIPFPEMLDPNNLYKFKSTDLLEGYFKPVVPDKKNEIVVYCFIGQTASVVYMAGRLLGYEVKLYDGSLQEWSRLEELPMEKTSN